MEGSREGSTEKVGGRRAAGTRHKAELGIRKASNSKHLGEGSCPLPVTPL